MCAPDCDMCRWCECDAGPFTMTDLTPEMRERLIRKHRSLIADDQ